MQRLSDLIVPVGFDAETTESAMGSISRESVHLEHNRPLPFGTFMQRFYFLGCFEQQGGSVVLLGQFVEDWMYRFPTRKPLGPFQPSFREEVLWLSAVIEQALTHPFNHALQRTAGWCPAFCGKPFSRRR